MQEVISAIIQAVATISAAVIGVAYAGKIVKKTTESHFFNYADKKHNLHKIMRKAKTSIIIIANCGDELLKAHYEHLTNYIKNNVKINFLLLDIKNYTYMDMYTTGKNNADYNALKTSLQFLSKLKREYPDKVSIKVFNSVLTSSYIGIDLEQNPLDNSWPSTALIQVMSYQFNTLPKNSPITHVSPEAKEQFQTIVDSMFEMWDCSNTVDPDEYLEQVIKYKQS